MQQASTAKLFSSTQHQGQTVTACQKPANMEIIKIKGLKPIINGSFVGKTSDQTDLFRLPFMRTSRTMTSARIMVGIGGSNESYDAKNLDWKWWPERRKTKDRAAKKWKKTMFSSVQWIQLFLWVKVMGLAAKKKSSRSIYEEYFRWNWRRYGIILWYFNLLDRR